MTPKKSTPARKPAAATASKSRRRSRSLEDVVGPEVYQTWVSMLRALVPEGRTHRLAPLVAAMLQYAFTLVYDPKSDEPAEGSVARSLLDLADAAEPEELADSLHDVVNRLFKEAGVEYRRVSAGGEPYSIEDSAYYEIIHWFDMPWDA